MEFKIEIFLDFLKNLSFSKKISDKTCNSPVRLKLLPIFLVGLFSDRKNQIFKTCVLMHNDEDDWYAQFRTAQKILSKVVVSNEAQLSSCG